MDQAQEIRELKAEIDALRSQLEGDIPRATRWLQTKVWRQRLALDALQKRVENQRFQLRTLNEMGRGLSREEYLAARNASKEPEKVLEEPVLV